MKRNIGIDLLRITAMVFIMSLHILGAGGILKNLIPGSVNFYVSGILESVFIVGVNLYALITGFVMVNSKPKIVRLLDLYFQVLFYSWVLFLIFVLFKITPINLVSLKSLFPLISKNYWYFNAYVVLFLFIPILNIAIKRLNKTELGTIILSSLFLFSILGIPSSGRSFFIEGGYSALWLMELYLIGAYIKMYNPLKNLKKRLLIICFIITSVGTFIFGYFMILVKEIIRNERAPFGGPELQYNSILIVLASIALFELFSRIKLKSTKFGRIITLMGSLSFSAYLIQTNPLVYSFLTNRFVFLTTFNPLLFVIAVISLGVTFFVLCILIDFGRKLIFRLINLDTFANWIVKTSSKLVKSIL